MIKTGIRKLLILLILGGANIGQLAAQSYTITDAPAHQHIQQRTDWQQRLNQLLSTLNAPRTRHCSKGNYPCIKQALDESEKMQLTLSLMVDEWEPLFLQTRQILANFQTLALPQHAKTTQAQYQTYFYLMRQLDAAPPEFIAYTFGKLGYLRNYHAHYAASQLLAEDAQQQQQKLHHVKRLMLQHIATEKALLSTL